jgi:hypothetical protein
MVRAYNLQVALKGWESWDNKKINLKSICYDITVDIYVVCMPVATQNRT